MNKYKYSCIIGCENNYYHQRLDTIPLYQRYLNWSNAFIRRNPPNRMFLSNYMKREREQMLQELE